MTAPVGNSFAEGNSGGVGAPELNTRAQSHGAWIDDFDRLYERLRDRNPDLRVWVDTLAANIQFRAETHVSDERARDIALRFVLFDRAAADIQKRGLVIDGSKNSCVGRAHYMMYQAIDALVDLGVF